MEVIMNIILNTFLIVSFLSFIPNTPTFAQAPSTCRSFQGVIVPYIPDPSLNNVGIATQDNMGRRIIVMNPNILNQFPSLARQFWYAHECAHHALNPPRNNEMNADCFAVQNLRFLGMMVNPFHVDQLLQSISSLPGNAGTGHLPGPARRNLLITCLQRPDGFLPN